MMFIDKKIHYSYVNTPRDVPKEAAGRSGYSWTRVHYLRNARCVRPSRRFFRGTMIAALGRPRHEERDATRRHRRTTMSFFDEMGADGQCRAQYKPIEGWLNATPSDALEFKRREAELIFRRTGITFAVYSENAGPERLIPFDIIPRVLDSAEWEFLSRGL